jgi:hypothetical protein
VQHLREEGPGPTPILSGVRASTAPNVKHGCVGAFNEYPSREHSLCAPIRRTQGNPIRIVLRARYSCSPTLSPVVPRLDVNRCVTSGSAIRVRNRFLTEMAGSARLWAWEDRNEQMMVDWFTTF